MNKPLGVYITDSYLYICTKEQIYQEKIPNKLVKYNRINLVDDLYKFINKIIKKYKLSDSLISKTVYVLELPNYLNSDKELILSLFDKLSFNKIKYIKYQDIIKEDTLNISLNNSYLKIKDKCIFLDHNLIIKQEDFETEYLNILKIYKNMFSNKIFLCGDYDNLINLAKKIEEQFNIKTYVYAQYQTEIIKNLQKQLLN